MFIEKQLKLKVVGCNPQDIVDGNLKQIMGVVFLLTQGNLQSSHLEGIACLLYVMYWCIWWAKLYCIFCILCVIVGFVYWSCEIYRLSNTIQKEQPINHSAGTAPQKIWLERKESKLRELRQGGGGLFINLH